MQESMGICMGETSPTEVDFISKTTPEVGEYVYLKYNDQIVLGMVESLFRGNLTIQDNLMMPDTIKRILEIEGEIDHYLRGTVKILGDKDYLRIPRTPAPPGTEVFKADTNLLKEIFHDEEGLKIGTVLTEEDVPVKLDINKMVSRHLAILAMTGAGKSNTTSVIIDELLRVNGTILLFDMHSEYDKAIFQNGEVKVIAPKINPRLLTIHEYKQLGKFSENATNQETYLREVFKKTKALDMEPTEKIDFLNTMIEKIHEKVETMRDEKERQSHIDAASQVEFKLNDMRDRYNKLLSSTDVGDLVKQIEPGKLNVVTLGSLDENATDIVVNHMLSKILYGRKLYMNPETRFNNDDALEVPVFCIVEEAHMLAARNRNTQSKYTISKIAREGRKFAVGLCLVSQSPKSLDSDTLSQINNLIILRLVEPSDQAHVQKSSESLSEDLLKQLPSLNIGEAIVLGQMTKIPTLVKIDEFKGKSVGNDLDIVDLWKRAVDDKEERIKEQADEIDQLF